MSDAVVIAADNAAEAAELAADVAAVAAAEPQPDPNVIVHAEVDLARMETETELAKIAARTEVKIAEIQAEKPEWLAELEGCLLRIEGRLASLEAMAAPSTPPISNVVITEPAPEPAPAPAVVAAVPESGEAMPVQPGAENPAPAPAPAQPRKSRWI